MRKPDITLKLWIVPHGYQVELRDATSHAPQSWNWEGCQDWSANYDVKQACVLLYMDIQHCIKTFENRHSPKAVTYGKDPYEA